MASRRKPTQEKSMEVTFEGILQSSIRAGLIAELIKYLVYQRQLLPLPFDQIKQDVIKDLAESESKEQPPRRKKRGFSKVEVKRKKQAVDALEEMFRVLDEVFALGIPIRQVLILLGSTVVSPKELYHVVLPSGVYDGNILTFKNCMSTFFRKLIASDLFGGTQDLKSSSKVTVLLLAPRECDFEGKVQLMTRATYKLPTRGRHFNLHFTCRGRLVGEQLSQLEETNFDISGIEPLEPSDMSLGMPLKCSSHNGSLSESGFMTCSANNLAGSLSGLNASDTPMVVSLGYHRTSLCESHMSVDSVDQDKLCQSRKQGPVVNMCEEPADDGLEYIWYQIPTVMKGFKGRSAQSSTDMWF